MHDAIRKVGRFEIESVLGRGGMAVVYLANQPDLGRKVALKELSAFHAADPSWARRFVAESRIAGSLGHSNIVTVHDYFEHEGTPYIAMEYMERGSLRPFVGGLSFTQIGVVLEGMLAGLAHAHGRGIVHRDLKPENLMVTVDGGIKIADFGIAKALHQPGTVLTLTQSGMTVGTPAYMAPEQAMAKTIGPRTDLYSAGIIAYELLAGRVPFSNTDTPWAILHAHIYEPPPPLRSLDPAIDPQLADWVERMLAKEPEDRPAGAEEAWHVLEDILVASVGPLWRRDARIPVGADAVEDGRGAPAPAPVGPAEPEPEPTAAEPTAAAPTAATPTAAAPTAAEQTLPGPPAVQDGTFEWPETGRPFARRRRGTLLLLLGGVALLGGGGFALATVGLGGGSDAGADRPTATTSATQATTSPPPPPPPPPAPVPPTASSLAMSEAGNAVRATVRFAGGRLGSKSVVVKDADLADGRAVVEVAQSGIRTRVGADRLAGLTVRAAGNADRIVFTLTATAGEFTTVVGRRDRTGRVVVLQATRAAVEPLSPPPSPQPPSPQPPVPQPPTPQPPPPPPPQTGTVAG